MVFSEEKEETLNYLVEFYKAGDYSKIVEMYEGDRTKEMDQISKIIVGMSYRKIEKYEKINKITKVNL
jgi:hypothetical protein